MQAMVVLHFQLGETVEFDSLEKNNRQGMFEFLQLLLPINFGTA
jgi:hypothetical protein